MDKEMLQSFHSCFDNYVSGFYSMDADTDFHIRLKEEHTIRVCENILSIGKSVGLNETALFLAETLALFHDIGRFKQFFIYRTFSDSKSEDHAILGVKVLKELKVLECLTDHERNIILEAIGYHNICCLPADGDAECLLFSKLIRDADKLDIYDILVKYYENPELYPHLKVGETSKISGYSNNVITDILNNRNIKYTDVKTSDDMKILRLSWIFDINYDFTLKQILDKRYVERIVKALPETKDIKKVQKNINAYIMDRFKI